MRSFYILLFSLFSSFLAVSQLPAGMVVVKGYVTYSNGSAVSNWPVYIMPDSTTTNVGCNQYHTKYTNSNGFYIDTLYCTTPIVKVRISTPDCNNTLIVHDPQVPTTRIVESNFTICTATNTCTASFSQFISGNNVYFTNTSSTSGGSVAQFMWSFGDGSTSTLSSPVHTYTSPGAYNVKLVIITNTGCQDSAIHSITILQPNSGCHAIFSDSISANKGFFFSGSSSTAQGDSIVERHWTFGDPNSTTNFIGGNVVNVNHTYANSGTYTVCLKTFTAGGCIDSSCHVVTINSSQTCQAYFIIEPSTVNNVFSFNSSNSSPANSIISRKWSFGDGDSLSGNVVNPQHSYTIPGTYTICLKITTANNCTSTICKTITIAASPHCIARFTVNPSPTVPPADYSVMFNSSTSEAMQGDSIIQRTWHFGNGGTLGGNVVSPVYNYLVAGIYNVCLEIFTASGCRDTACITIQVPLQNQSTCYSIFTANPSILNNYLYAFNSSSSYSVPASTITSRIWYFGDGDTLAGNIVTPQHLYKNAGTYTICLKIITAGGCVAYSCKTISIAPAHCQAKLTVTSITTTTTGYQAQFNSNLSAAVAGDSIVERIWKFGDGGINAGNTIAPTHIYTSAGTYTACLIIRTAKGCSDTACIQVYVNGPVQNNCIAYFQYSPSGNTVRFMSNYSSTNTNDTIVSRYWSFGDSTFLTGNVANPSHTYAFAGTYNVCLKVTTSSGCQNTICKTIIITSVPASCISYFTTEKINSSPTTIRFNSISSWAALRDSIISRQWNFGDGSPFLTGNVINPLHTYPVNGTYKVCLRITTLRGCTNEYCIPLKVGDSTIVPDTTQPIKIVSLSPNPATNQFSTLVWSKYNNVYAQYAIYDIYGVKKWSINKILLQGNNVTTIPSYFLLPGPYFFRITTIYGIQSRKFYKM